MKALVRFLFRILTHSRASQSHHSIDFAPGGGRQLQGIVCWPTLTVGEEGLVVERFQVGATRLARLSGAVAHSSACSGPTGARKQASRSAHSLVSIAS